MSPRTDYYRSNPLIFRDRRLARSESAWVRAFACEDMRPLIVCRGPIRKEAMDVFHQMGMRHYGILLSEKDSIVYTHALAPELRQLRPDQVHRVPDYTGASKEERAERVRQIIGIAKEHGYGYIFAGYGFMAEDEDFVTAIEGAGLRFIGPCSRTVRAAGRKDEAKRTALRENVSVTPGVDNATARTLLAKAPDRAALSGLVKEYGLRIGDEVLEDTAHALEDLAELVLDASYAKGIDLYTIEELCAQVEREVAALFRANPRSRIRLKAISGGGGKGQRILAAPGDVSEERMTKAAAIAAEKTREILNEVKATGVGDNKNVLLEQNIETTRHHEIQLLGNGEWCVSLGGRDCSLQMHEQKLLEVSLTDEGFRLAIERVREHGAEAAALEQDRRTLGRMEAEAERFGRAVGLDSASTFECIVDGDSHFFMEVNTRIQVEHRVSELCYKLRFTNPDDPQDYFDVESLVEAMALLAKHKDRLPRPERHPREMASVEARLNATDRALQPHAGGVVVSWSDPIEGEVRDDQGICTKNPDTGLSMRYKVAGAYDSNIALLVTTGVDRKDSYDRLHEILRRTKLRGLDLETNLGFHFGLVNWFRGRNVFAKPTTRFVVPYLTQVGLLKEEANEIDTQFAHDETSRILQERLRSRGGDSEALKKAVAASGACIDRKLTLLKRPMDMVLGEGHFLSAWLSMHHNDYLLRDGRVEWVRNPLHVLDETYKFLNMDQNGNRPAAHAIWSHDRELLDRSLTFYHELGTRLGISDEDWRALTSVLDRSAAPAGFDAGMWGRVRAAHVGFSSGLQVLGVLPLIGEKTGFLDLRLNEDLTIHIPDRLTDSALQGRMRKVLVPPPPNKADEIVAVSGGMFYAQESPDLPLLIEKGEHFDAGQPLYIIEVMKMFNKVPAPFAGTVDEVLVEGVGTIVHKGQPLFKVTPDEIVEEEDPVVRSTRRRENTRQYMQKLV